LSDYIDKLGAKEGWHIIFDRDKDKSWEEKIYIKTQKLINKTIHELGC
jgi:hypothetical protein